MRALLLSLALLLSACAATPARVAFNAELAAIAAMQEATSLLDAGKISSDEAERVLQAAIVVRAAAPAIAEVQRFQAAHQ